VILKISCEPMRGEHLERALGSTLQRGLSWCCEPNGSAGEGYRLYFFSREESRPHVHVQHTSGEAKIWLQPTIEMAQNWGLSKQRLNTVLRLAKEHADEILSARETHFGR
jgi:hypothetical protein